jgi:hypothetical protein
MTDRKPEFSAPGLNQLIQKKKAENRLKQFQIASSPADPPARTADEPLPPKDRPEIAESEMKQKMADEPAIHEPLTDKALASSNAVSVKVEPHPAVSWEKRKMEGKPHRRPVSDERRMVLPTVAPAIHQRADEEPARLAVSVKVEPHPAVSWEKRKMEGKPHRRPVSDERRMVLPTVAPAMHQSAEVKPAPLVEEETAPSMEPIIAEPPAEFPDPARKQDTIPRSRTERILEEDMPAASLHLGSRKKWLLGAVSAVVIVTSGSVFAFVGMEGSPQVPSKPALRTKKETDHSLSEWTEQPDETVAESSGKVTDGTENSARKQPSHAVSRKAPAPGQKEPRSNTSLKPKPAGPDSGSGTTPPDSGTSNPGTGTGDPGTGTGDPGTGTGDPGTGTGDPGTGTGDPGTGSGNGGNPPTTP